MPINIRLRRGTAAEWSSANPVLYNGELVVETDTYQVKIGDGSTSYNSLPYGFDSGEVNTINSFFF